MIIQSRASLKAILPHDWLISRLGLHGKFMSGSAFPDQFQGRCNEEIPFYKVADLARSSDGVHMLEPMHTISDETRKRLKAKLIPKGSIVYAKIGAASLLNRRRVTTRSCCIDNNMTAFVPEQVSPEWALIWLRSLDFGAYMCPATVPSISEGIQADLPLGLPPMEYEQRSIALLNERLPKIDKLITLLEDKSSALSSYRQSLITRAVTKGLDPNVEMKDSGVAWIGKIPRNFKTIKLKYCLKSPLQYGATESGCAEEENYIRYIRITDINPSGFLKENGKLYLPKEIAEQYPVKTKDILFARSGATVGKTYFHNNKDDCCFAGYLIKASLSDSKILPKFFYYFTKSACYDFWKDITLSKATIQNISADRLNDLSVVCPPIQDQIQIIKFCDDLINETEAIAEIIKTTCNLLIEYRTSLISAAVTGQLAIDEEASA